ncbi:hypothetical protein [Pseudorhodoferax soli]|nr:hypothetical protein [Pseudorhodoferax soli]
MADRTCALLALGPRPPERLQRRPFGPGLQDGGVRRYGMFHRGASMRLQARYIRRLNLENSMAKGEQRSNKMTKKPKKDSSAPPSLSTSTSTRPTPPTTTVMPKGKLKNKPA